MRRPSFAVWLVVLSTVTCSPAPEQYAASSSAVTRTGPIARIVRDGGDATGPAPFYIQLDGATSSCPGSWCAAFDWDFGDATPHASAIWVAHTFQKAGTYDVTLRVTDGKRRTGTATLAVVVAPPPPPPPPPCGDSYQDCCTTGPACKGSMVCAAMGDGPNGVCVTPDAPGGPCEDHNPCTIDQSGVTWPGCLWIGVKDASCRSDTCVLNGVTTVCDDGNPCTRDLCDPATHCWAEADWAMTGAACDDADACTVGDACSQGMCYGQPSADPVCLAACIPTSAVEDCGTPADDDCNGFTNEADPACALTCDVYMCPSGMSCDSRFFCKDDCTNGVKSGTEGDVDCGGTCATRCATGQSCNQDADCSSKRCVFADPSAFQGVCT